MVKKYDMTNPDSVRQAVALRLHNLLQQRVAQAGSIDAAYADLFNHVMSLISRGGKRLRPLLAIWSYAGCGGTDTEAILQVAAALELFHAGILMHDDIIDGDTMRWGGQNVSGVYRASLAASQPRQRAAQLADAHALLAGDLCITLAYEQVLASSFAAGRARTALQRMYDTFFSVAGGELLDVEVSVVPLADLNQQTLLKICEYKTATYSFGLPLEIGAQLAGADMAQLERIRELSKALGTAYQLQDDLMGMFGDSAQTGKSAISDLREGKRTILICLAYQQASSADRAILEHQLGNRSAGPAELELVQKVFRRTSAQADTQALVTTYYHQAEMFIEAIGWEESYAARVKSLCTSLQSRQA